MGHVFLRFSLGMLVVVLGPCMVHTSFAQKAESSGSASISTPRAGDGHPDLSGMWNGAAGGVARTSEDSGNITSNVASRRCAPNQKGCGDQTNQTVDGEFTGRMDPNRPLY